jgi:hypothetical protein
LNITHKHHDNVGNMLHRIVVAGNQLNDMGL